MRNCWSRTSVDAHKSYWLTGIWQTEGSHHHLPFPNPKNLGIFHLACQVRPKFFSIITFFPALTVGGVGLNQEQWQKRDFYCDYDDKLSYNVKSYDSWRSSKSLSCLLYASFHCLYTQNRLGVWKYLVSTAPYILGFLMEEEELMPFESITVLWLFCKNKSQFKPFISFIFYASVCGGGFKILVQCIKAIISSVKTILTSFKSNVTVRRLKTSKLPRRKLLARSHSRPLILLSHH